MIDLDAWLDANNPAEGAKWTLISAAGVTDAGLITGYGIYDYDDGRGLNARPPPARCRRPWSPRTSGDFNDDGTVDAADFAQWQGDFGLNGDSDADNDDDSDGADFLVWQRQLGMANARVATEAVPEPAGISSSSEECWRRLDGAVAPPGFRRDREPQARTRKVPLRLRQSQSRRYANRTLKCRRSRTRMCPGSHRRERR